jgi:hypothetical protein
MHRRQLLRLVACSLGALTVTATLSPSLVASEFGDSPALDWTLSLEPGSGGTVTLVAIARIATGYIVYGSDIKGAIGPRPSRVKLDPASGVQPDGELASIAARSCAALRVRRASRVASRARPVTRRMAPARSTESRSTCRYRPVSAAATLHR